MRLGLLYLWIVIALISYPNLNVRGVVEHEVDEEGCGCSCHKSLRILWILLGVSALLYSTFYYTNNSFLLLMIFPSLHIKLLALILYTPIRSISIYQLNLLYMFTNLRASIPLILMSVDCMASSIILIHSFIHI